MVTHGPSKKFCLRIDYLDFPAIYRPFIAELLRPINNFTMLPRFSLRKPLSFAPLAHFDNGLHHYWLPFFRTNRTSKNN